MNARTVHRLATAAITLALTAALGAGGAASVLAAAPAAASTTLSVSDLKQKCETAISNRLTFLADATTRVNGATVLTAEHRSALLGIISSDQSGLTALKSKIDGDTTYAQLKPDCQAIVNDYRVYVLVGPQVHLVIASDRVDWADDKFQGMYGKIESALQHCSGDGCQAAETAFADLKSKVQAAIQANAGVAARVLALTPAGYPGNEATLTAARTSISNAHADLQAALQDAKTIRQALKDSASAASPAATPTAGA